MSTQVASAEKDVMVDFESVDISDPDYVHDGSRFWLKNNEQEWIHLTESSMRRHLVGLGYSVKPESNATLSGVDKCLNDVELNYRVKWVGPLAGHWSGFKTMGGNKVLVTVDPVLVDQKPAPETAACLPESDAFGDSRGWPILGRVFRNMLSCPSEGDKQLWCVFCYIRHTLDCLYEKTWAKAPTLALAGEIDCGKSLLVELFRELFAKKIALPYKWMVGEENFNGDMLEAVLLSIDDEVSDTNPKSRAKLGEHCKKITSTTFQRIRALLKEGLALQPLWRLIICVNNTPDKLMVLPQMEDDNEDKILLIKAYAKKMPMPSESPEDQKVFWDTLMAELPHFVWWIRNEFQIPVEWRGRFGVKAYHHPEILKALSELSTEQQFWYYLEKTIFAGGFKSRVDPRNNAPLGKWEWMGKVGDLYGFLTDTKAEDRFVLTPAEASSIPKPGWIGQRLSRLAKIYPDSVIQRRTTNARYWHIKAPKSMLEGVGADTHDDI